MLYLIVGENSYTRDQAVATLVADRVLERVDGATLEPKRLPDLLAGQTLFASERVIAIRDLSLNKLIWEQLESWLARLDDTTTLILLEKAVDKRTKTYKYLQKTAKIVVCDYWRERDSGLARRWLDTEIAARQLTIAPDLRAELIARAIRPSDSDGRPVIDQQRLATALDQLSGMKVAVSREQIDVILPATASENVFGLLAAALAGDRARVHEMCQHLATHEDGFKVFGLVDSQIANLVALVVSGQSAETLAGQLSISPYALRALEREARQLDRARAERIVSLAVRADRRLKLGAEPWPLLETLLQQIVLD